jgi:hypothetical protein
VILGRVYFMPKSKTFKGPTFGGPIILLWVEWNKKVSQYNKMFIEFDCRGSGGFWKSMSCSWRTKTQGGDRIRRNKPILAQGCRP